MGVGVLTHRQAEILKYHRLGYTQKEISQALGVSQPRVSRALKDAEKKIRLAKDTLEFLEELRYLKEMRERGFKGELVLR